MRDRTKEMRGDIAEDEDKDEECTPLNPGGTSMGTEENDFESIKRRVQEILKELESLRGKIDDLDHKEKTELSAVLPKDERDGLKKEILTLVDEIKMMASQIKEKLKDFEPKKGVDDGAYESVYFRVQQNQHYFLTEKSGELMDNFCSIQVQYKDRTLEDLQKQITISGYNEMTKEEIMDRLENGKTVAAFTQDMLGKNEVTQQELNEIASRYGEILKVEQSIMEIHEMIHTIAYMVESQGETMNDIEANVCKSTNYVEKGVGGVEESVANKRKACKKKIWIAVCLTVITLILILVISLAFAFGR